MLDRWITYVLLSLTSTEQEANRSWTVLDENTVCPPVRTMDRTLKYRNWVFDPPNSRLHTTNCQKKKIQFSSQQIKLIVRVCVCVRAFTCFPPGAKRDLWSSCLSLTSVGAAEMQLIASTMDRSAKAHWSRKDSIFLDRDGFSTKFVMAMNVRRSWGTEVWTFFLFSFSPVGCAVLLETLPKMLALLNRPFDVSRRGGFPPLQSFHRLGHRRLRLTGNRHKKKDEW